MRKELILNINNMSFTQNDITTVDAPYVHDYIPISYQNISSGDVNKSNRYSDYRREKFKFLTTHNGNITFSEYQDYSFKDWRHATNDLSGYSYSSYIITGYIVGDNFALNKQANYLSIFFDRTETEYISTSDGIELFHRSGCKVQSLWDWHGDDSMWSKNGKEFIAYKLRHPLPDFSNETGLIKYPDDVIITKNKLRGRGRSLSLKFSSEDGKDMKLIGWHIPLTQVDKV